MEIKTSNFDRIKLLLLLTLSIMISLSALYVLLVNPDPDLLNQLTSLLGNVLSNVSLLETNHDNTHR